MVNTACAQFRKIFREMNEQFEGSDNAFAQLLASGDPHVMNTFDQAYDKQQEFMTTYKAKVLEMLKEWRESSPFYYADCPFDIDDNGKVTAKGSIYLHNTKDAPQAKGYFPQMIRKVDDELDIEGVQVGLDNLEEVAVLGIKGENDVTGLKNLRICHNLMLSRSGVTTLPSLERVEGIFQAPPTLVSAPRLRFIGSTMSMHGAPITTFESLEQTGMIFLGSRSESTPRLQLMPKLEKVQSFAYYGTDDIPNFEAIFPALREVGDFLGDSFSLLRRHPQLLATLERLKREKKVSFKGSFKISD